MKNTWIILIFSTLFLQESLAQSTWKFEQLSHWDDDNLPIAGVGWVDLQYSGCWGMAVNGREYAVVGAAEHILIFDITDPTSPQLKLKHQGTVNTVWREFNSYKNRLYAVSDASNEGLLVFDFSHAEDSIPLRYWSNEFFTSAHTITLDTVSGRIYLNGGSATLGVIVLDVSQNPDQPTMISHSYLSGGYLHDSYVRNDTLYASSGNEGYHIYNMKDPLQPELLASINTGGYNHNSWLSKDGAYAYYTEEIPTGRPIRIIDLKNLGQGVIESVGTFLDKFSVDNGDNTAIPHNVFIRDNFLFDSQYEDGILAYDISEPLQPRLLDRFDTHPSNDLYNGYFGNWGNYPWLPSGNVIACDMQEGLYVLRFHNTAVGTTEASALDRVQLFPNPVQDRLEISGAGTESLYWNVSDLTGRTLMLGTLSPAASQLDLGGLAPGAYFLRLQDDNGNVLTKKIIKA